MVKGDRCAVFRCNNNRRYDETFVVKDHTGFPPGGKHTFQVLQGSEKVQEFSGKEDFKESISRSINALKFVEITLD